MAILFKQVFSADLAKNLFPDNAFYKNSKDDSAFVESDVVNLPHAGSIPGVEVDRTTKGVAAKRVDSATSYDLSELSTDPTWIQYSEELIVNYAKRANIVEEHSSALNTAIADFMAHEWATNAGVVQVRTTGAAVRPAGSPSATGNRKRIVLADLLNIQKAMNKQEIPLEGRFAVITPDMLEDLLMIDEVKNSDFNKVKPLVDGSVGMFLGFNFFVRSRVNVYDNAGTPALKAIGAAGAAADNQGAIFWNKNFVRRAEGGVKTFAKIGDPELYGDAVSALVRCGGIGANKDGKGVIALIESASA